MLNGQASHANTGNTQAGIIRIGHKTISWQAALQHTNPRVIVFYKKPQIDGTGDS